MRVACDELRERLAKRTTKGHNYDMQSIIVIMPGLEQVDQIYSAAFKMDHFNFQGKPAFQPRRLTSLVKDDPAITSECRVKGTWHPDGHLGRIVITTNLVAAGLTVPGAAYVIDSGLQEVPDEWTRDGLRSLSPTLIDGLTIVQRSSRTGRTTDGQYFLPFSPEKVKEMMESSLHECMLHRNFDERHLFYKMRHGLELLHEPSAELQQQMLQCMEIRGAYSPRDGFPRDVVLLHDLINFLSPEYARIVIQGVRLGIAAHVIYLIAERISRVNFCHGGLHGRGMNDGPSLTKSAIDLYCEAMDRVGERWMKMPAPYRGRGDSIAQADLMSSFFALTRRCKPLSRATLNEVNAPPNSFWGEFRRPKAEGAGGGEKRAPQQQQTLYDLYTKFVRYEGQDAVSRWSWQIFSALHSAGLLPEGARSPLDTRMNRHIVSEENFCLNKRGRALLNALLTLHSSRVGVREEKPAAGTTSDDLPAYTIYKRKEAGEQAETILPEARYTQPLMEGSERPLYGRYFEMCKKREGYQGLIDPVTILQITYLLNINGSSDNGLSTVRLTLNASTAEKGLLITGGSTDVAAVRSALQSALEKLTRTSDGGVVLSVEQSLVQLWTACGEEQGREGATGRGTTPPPSQSRLAAAPPPPRPLHPIPRAPPPPPAASGQRARGGRGGARGGGGVSAARQGRGAGASSLADEWAEWEDREEIRQDRAREKQRRNANYD